MLFVKALLGLAGVGAGALAPVVAKRLAKEVPTEAVEFVNNLNVVKAVKEKLATSPKDLQVNMALRNLKEKGCKLIVNPLNMNNSFDALHACNEEGKTSFYYLGSVESFKKDLDSYQLKKVVSVNYQEGSDQKTAKLNLTLEGNQQVDLAIENQGEGGWSHFKNVNLNEKCKLETPVLGGDLLRCELQDSKDNSTFSYAFSAFR